MRKSRRSLFEKCLVVAVLINLICVFFVFPHEMKLYRAICWDNPWFGIVQIVICWGAMVTFLMLSFFEHGRIRGIEEAEREQARKVMQDRIDNG